MTTIRMRALLGTGTRLAVVGAITLLGGVAVVLAVGIVLSGWT